MLRLTLELVPYGDERAKKVIKQVLIANDGMSPDSPKLGNYKVKVHDDPRLSARWRQRFISNFPRKHYDAMYLVYLVIRKLVHEEGVEPIDDKARTDKDRSSGLGHCMLPDSSGRTLELPERDRVSAGYVGWDQERLADQRARALSLGRPKLQKNNLPGVQSKPQGHETSRESGSN